LIGGGAGSLDSLFAGGDGSYYQALSDGDTVLYSSGGEISLYQFRIGTAPQTEHSPDIIVPDFQSSGAAYAGNGAWHLATFKGDQGEVTFTSTLATFAPTLVVTGTPTILWTFADGTTSASATPTKDYGTAASRVNRLKVTPWSALTRVNIGFDGGDGGSGSIEHVTNQGVSAVGNMYLMAPYLRQWCSSYNSIPSLNFDSFVLLDTIECYNSSSLVNVSLHNTPLLARACFEGCSLTYIDFSESPSMADFRGASNPWNGWNWGATGLHLRHFCSHSCSNLNTQLPSDGAQFPVIEELWISNNDLIGKLRVRSPVFSSLWGTGNHWTEADFTGCFPTLSDSGSIELDGNELTSLIITGCIGLDTLSASDNHLSAEMVTSVLQVLDAGGNTGGTVDLSGNAIPTAAGITAASNLTGKGWTVTIDEEEATLVSIAVTPDDGTLNTGATQQFTATGTYSDSSTQNITSQVTWDSSNDSYATISSGGLATGVGAGEATISATLGEISGNTTLTVNAVTLVSIAITPNTPSIYAGHTQQFTATGTYSDSSTGNITSQVTWSSNHTEYATITSSGGLATGVAAGNATITATLGEVSDTEVLTVNAVTLSSIAVTPASPSIAVGATQQFTATGTYNDSSTANITSSCTWTSGTEATATIGSGTGLATAVAAGTSEITATLGGVHNHANITVTAAQEARILFDTETAETTVVLSVTGTPTITWHWGDSTTTNGGTTGTKDFGSAGHRSNYVTVDPPTAVTGVAVDSGSADHGVSSLSGLSGFANLNMIHAFQASSLAALDISGCHSVRSFHLVGSSLGNAAMDIVFNDLIEAVPGAVTTTALWSPATGTTASHDARVALIANGWDQSYGWSANP